MNAWVINAFSPPGGVASGEQTTVAGGALALGGTGDGWGLAVGGGGLALGGTGDGWGLAVGASLVEPQAAVKISSTRNALRKGVMRAACAWCDARLDIELKFARVRVGLFGVEQPRG